MADKAEPWIFRLTVASAASLLVSIAVAEILFAAACLVWLTIGPRRLAWPRYFLPLAFFMLATGFSLALSPDPGAGLGPIKKFILFGMGLLSANFVRSERQARISTMALLSVASAAGAVAIIQFAIHYSKFLATGNLADDPTVLARITGFMGHWMTFSGEQMLVWCAALPAVLAFTSRRWRIPLWIAGAALVLSFTRSVWLGAIAAVAVLGALTWERRLIRMLLPVVAVTIAASGLIAHRLSMSFGEKFSPDVGRIDMAIAGLQMIHDHPWAGVGPERVRAEFPKYYQGENLNRIYYGHLHNNFLQIAAERGLPCLGAWVWLVLILSVDLFRMARSVNPAIRWTALSGISALTGFVVAGLFEYNFGDSEVLLLFLFIVSVPYGVPINNDGFKPEATDSRVGSGLDPA